MVPFGGSFYWFLCYGSFANVYPIVLIHSIALSATTHQLTTKPNPTPPKKQKQQQKLQETMKLPQPATAPPMEFANAKGSTVPQEFAMEVRKNPDLIPQMAETRSEVKELQTEALVRQYVIIVDRSGSMTTGDGLMKTRWDSARKAVEKLVDAVFKYDTDGRVPLYLFDDQVEFVGECTNSSQIKGVFESYKPRGTTKLAECLDAAMKTYLAKNRVDAEFLPGTTFIVILDGTTDSNESVKTVINHYADPANGYIKSHTDAAISFLRIGDDPGAIKFLQELDDGSPEYPDIIDTKPDNFIYQKDGPQKLLYDAIFD